MTLFDIERRIADMIDPETGELLDYEAFAALQVEREEKIETVALWIKELNAKSLAIGDEIERLSKRKKAAESKAKRLKEYLDLALDGQKFSTARCAVSFRKTWRCEVTPTFIDWAEKAGRDDLLTYKRPTPNLAAIKEAIAAGEELPDAEMVAGRSVSVK